MKRSIAVVLIVLVATQVAAVLAHEGHEHKIMGTVSMVHENHLEVKMKDGKSSVVTVNDKTRILRGTATAKLEDIKNGERVVVTAVESKQKDGAPVMTAREVRLAAAR
jgi:hypothetical protein